jgi:hypothetical protein
MSPLIAATLTALAPLGAASAADLEEQLSRRLRGAWGVLRVEVGSGCGATYSDNLAGDIGVASKAAHRFSPGELVMIDKLKLKREQVDLLLTLKVPLRRPRTDGPFELVDDLECRVQLMVPVPREQVKNSDVEAILGGVGAFLFVYPDLESARASVSWNRREPPPLPEGYDETLQRHAVWKAEQVNAAVAASTARALDAAGDIAGRLGGDADYLAGFATGAQAMSSFYLSDCSSLLEASIWSYRKAADRSRSSRWQNGWDDGQSLVFHVLVADRLQACLLPAPAASPP